MARTDEFGEWWAELTEAQQDRVAATVRQLELRGPQLPFPYSSGVAASRHPHMRELRVQSRGSPLRIFYAFDKARAAVLLIGGSKKGDDRFYERMVPRAERIWEQYVKEQHH